MKSNFIYPKILICLSILLPATLFAQKKNLWKDISESKIFLKGQRQIIPQKYRTVSLDLNALQLKLALSPLESTTTKKTSSMVVTFPMPDGQMQNFKIVESPIMEPGLTAKFPNLKTYLAQGIDDPHATMRFDITHKGFHGMILSPNGAVFIDPYSSASTDNYITYYKNDYVANKKFVCHVSGTTQNSSNTGNNAKLNVFSNGTTLRTYRMAVAATGEYTSYHGGSVADGLAAIVTTMNRVNQVYENDFAIRMILVANNDQIIYTNGNTDPFNNNNAGTLIGQSQTEIDGTIGSNNYDIGHTVSTGGGGLASLRVPCSNGSKARGITGSGNPVGDPYDIDYVAHEIGHQFGGNHTFNGSSGSCGGNISSHSYEPGSGSTIQAYAGICSPQNLQSNSDPYFHFESLREMLDYATNGTGNGCPAKTPTGNTPPVASHSMATSLTIPINTPFELTGEGTDPDNDVLTYCWEQFDLGPQGAPESPSGNAPIFRSWNPNPNPVRTFPRLSNLLVNSIPYGEILPTYTRSLEFRLTVRDNRAGGGGVHCAGYSVDVDDNSGPFLVTTPNTTGIVWEAGSSQTVAWDVANTTAAPVSCANVDILLSTDGGNTYPTALATGIPNNGSASIVVPNAPSTTVRIKVICSDNIFFDISNQNIEILVTGPDFSLSGLPSDQSVCTPDNGIYTISLNAVGGYTNPVNLTATGLPAGMNAVFSPATISGGSGTSSLSLNTTGVTPGNYSITLEGDGSIGTKMTTIDIVVLEGIPGTVLPANPENGLVNASVFPVFSWDVLPGAERYTFELAADPMFSQLLESASGLTVPNFDLGTTLSPNTSYYWRVRADNFCGVGSYSSVHVFLTENVTCSTYSSTDIPISISDSGTPSITSELTIPDAGTILDVNVLNLAGDHTWINDLEFVLTSPDNTSVEIISRSCGNQNNFDLNLDDDATGTWPCPPTDGGTYPPSQALSAFNGTNLNGTWGLTVNDNANQDGGSLNSWELEICYSVPSSIGMPIKVLLEGPYDDATELMNDALRVGGAIPLLEPFTGIGYTFVGGGGESTTNPIFTTGGSAAIIDWVVVELRDAADNTNIVASQAALLQADGDIVGLDGLRSISFAGFSGAHFVAVKSRNHLSAMSAQPIVIDDGSVVDFTDPGFATYGTNAQTTLNGVQLLHTGDATSDGQVNAADRSKAWNDRNQLGYFLSDVNMDGNCDASDRSSIWNNRNQEEQLP